jgi:hypothetical protein
MGLSLLVGIDDPEFREEMDEEFAAINAVLRAAGLPEHREPKVLHGGAPWLYHIGSYSCLHYLRRVATHLALGHGIPRPDLDNAPKDPVLHQYYHLIKSEARFTDQPGGSSHSSPATPRSQHTVQSGLPFSHLMCQSDCAGYYLPQPFPEVLELPNSETTAFGGRLGSSHLLRTECEELARRLEYPREIGLERLDETRRRAQELQDRSGWEPYVVESFVCEALLTAAEISIQSGCVLIFC